MKKAQLFYKMFWIKRKKKVQPYIIDLLFSSLNRYCMSTVYMRHQQKISTADIYSRKIIANVHFLKCFFRSFYFFSVFLLIEKSKKSVVKKFSIIISIIFFWPFPFLFWYSFLYSVIELYWSFFGKSKYEYIFVGVVWWFLVIFVIVLFVWTKRWRSLHPSCNWISYRILSDKYRR